MKKTLLAAALTLGVSGVAQAALINVGGVVWDPDDILDFTATDTIFETVAAPVIGSTVTGFGEIQSFNGENDQNVFCPGCELTYTFSFDLVGFNDNNANLFLDSGDELAFGNMSVSVFVDHGGIPFSLAGGPASASDGVLFLSLAGHEVVSSNGLTGELFTTITGGILGTGSEGGNGIGLLDVTGGLAASNFDTNSFLAPGSTGANLFADINFSSSFQPIPSGGVPPYILFGSNDFSGNTIPEPGTIALMGLSLLGLGGAMRRKRTS